MTRDNSSAARVVSLPHVRHAPCCARLEAPHAFAVTSFGSLSQGNAAAPLHPDHFHSDCSASHLRGNKSIFEFGGGGQGRVTVLLQLPCLAIAGVWILRSHAMRTRPTACNSVKRVTVDMRLSPTPLPSHRDSADLPGSPPWLQKIERQRLRHSIGTTVAKSPSTSMLNHPPPISSRRITLELPTVPHESPATDSHSPPRTPSYHLAPKQKCQRHQSQPGSRGPQRIGAVSAEQLVHLDDRFKTSPHPSRLSLISNDRVPASSLSNDTEASLDSRENEDSGKDTSR